MFRKLSSIEFPQLKALQTEISFFCEKKLICCSYDRNKSSIYLLLKSLNNSFQNNDILKTDHSDFLKMIDNVRILTFIHKL